MFPDRFLTNITVQVPNSTTQHGNKHILCLPITKEYWPSVAAVIIFFATNYLAHAATVKSSPGDDTLLQACNAILALFFPMSGLLRALNAIARLPILARRDLERACKAGALCMVVRAPHWRPKLGQKLSVGVVLEDDERTGAIDLEVQPDSDHPLPIIANMITYLPSYAREHSSTWIHFDSVWARSRVDLRLTKVHGTYDLPEGYEFAIVPRNTFLISQVASNIQGDSRLTSEISAGYSVLKAVASIIQVVAAFTTLLSHRPDLIRRWGYASYHLTVIPYLAMTLVNFISNMVSPDYPCLYMVRSETMVEAEMLGGRFEGEIAQMVSLLPGDAMEVENPAWSGLSRKDIQKFSNKLASTASEVYVLDRVLHLLDLILARNMKKKKKKLSAKDAKIVHLEVVSQFSASPPPPKNDHEISTTQDNLHVELLDRNFPNDGGNEQTPQPILSTGDTSTQLYREDILAKERDSKDEFQIQIPRAPQLSLGKGFSYTIRRVLEDMLSSQGNRIISFPAILQNIQQNKKSLKTYRFPGSYFHRAVFLYKLALKEIRIPTSSEDDPKLFPVRSAIIYYPNCQRFLRWDDFADPPKASTGNTSVNQLRAPSPITESAEATLAASISNVRTLLRLPDRPATSTASVTELEDLLRSPVITRTSGQIGWAILVEIGIGACIVGLFIGLIAGLTKFHAGDSSTTERGIMMAWLASGLYGFCLPLLSTLELLKVLFLFPLIVHLYLTGAPEFMHHSLQFGRILRDSAQTKGDIDWKERFKTFFKSNTKLNFEILGSIKFPLFPQLPALFLYAFALIPLGIFIPPIWGFVLVGRMLTEWGDCVRLY